MSEIKLSSEIDVELIDWMGTDVSLIRAAKVSTGTDFSVSEMDLSAQQGFINYLMKNRHGTPFEHGSMTFRISAPIFVFREWHRHRIGWSYNEESARYKEMEPKFYIPNASRPMVQVGKPGHYTYEQGTADQWGDAVNRMGLAYERAYDMYKLMLEDGIAREIARTVLPVGIYSSMYATCNPRSLMAFLSLRTKDETATYPSSPQHEIEVAARQMEHCFSSAFKLTHNAFQQFGRVAP